MRAVVQRVSQAAVTVADGTVGQIAHGVLVYLGVASDDTPEDIAYLVNKVRHLRIFPDDQGKMNLNVEQVGGACLVVSAFTTQGDARKGHRPAYTAAAAPQDANEIYENFCSALRDTDLQVETGQFQAHMDVQSVNDGPVCVLIDSKRVF